MIKIEMTAELRELTSNRGKPYCLQMGYAYTLDRDGKPKKYPTEIQVYRASKEEAYKPGNYILAPSSIGVTDRGGLEIPFINLVEHRQTN